MTQLANANRLFKALWLIVVTALVIGAVPHAGPTRAVYAAATVTNCVYSGSGGLEDALAAGGIVTFACDGTILVPQLSPLVDTTLDATGRSVTLSGGNANRVLSLNPGLLVSLIHLTITGGNGLQSSGNGGGGILNYQGTLTVISSTVTGNSAQFNGGGINNDGGTLVVLQSTISNNSNVNSGAGGIENSGVLTVTNSTISGNYSAAAGGIRNNNGLGVRVAIIDSTISNNVSVGSGAGINNFGHMRLRNTIVADNIGPGNCYDLTAIVSDGHNLSSDNSCNLAEIGDLSNVEPVLGPLQDNGGPTFTQALQAGSPAIGTIPRGKCAVRTDQRGLQRPGAGKTQCDIGAYETQAGSGH